MPHLPKESQDTRLEWTLDEAKNGNFNNYAALQEGSPEGRENDAFAYPGPFTRNIDGTTNARLSPKITRGFMRSIIMGKDIADKLNPGGKNPGNLRLNFQFNPEYIERRVSQSPGAVNPLLQNPANLTQAVPGTAQFNFTMLFNREAEVAQRRKNLNTTEIIGNVADNMKLDITENAINDSLKDPGQVGVMHDLAIFDSIIGQGITSELVDVISTYTRQQVVAQTNNAKEDEDVPVFEDVSFRASVAKNFGNSAFLNPMPIRIVFSDLFMVEGLVVGSAVAFQKFSQDMIPTVCQVNVEVYALYVGFAKKTAFLTDNLTSWATDVVTDAAAQAAEVKRVSKEIKNSLMQLNLGVNFGHSLSRENELLDTPPYNTLGMRVYFPTYAGDFYAGNEQDTEDRFVTLPQWFNAFAASNSSLDIMKDNTGAFVGTNVFSSFGNKTLLPITMYLHTTDSNFSNVTSTFTVTIQDTTTAQNKSTTVSNGGAWKPIVSGEAHLSPSKTTGGQTIYVFKNTMYVDPKDVSNKKQTISKDSRCKLSISIVFNKKTADGTNAVHTLSAEFYYNGNQPFYYDIGKLSEGTAAQPGNFQLVKERVFNLKQTEGKGGN